MTMGLMIWMAAVYACYKLFRTDRNWRRVLTIFAAAAAVSTLLMLFENKLAAGAVLRQFIESLSSASLVALAGELLILFFLRRDWRKYEGKNAAGKITTFDEFYVEEVAAMEVKKNSRKAAAKDKDKK